VTSGIDNTCREGKYGKNWLKILTISRICPVIIINAPVREGRRRNLSGAFVFASIKRWATVRNSLYVTSGVTTALLVVLTVGLWLDAHKVHEEANRIIEGTVIEDLFIEAAADWSWERSLTQAALFNKNPISDHEYKIIKENRTFADTSFKKALTLLKSYRDEPAYQHVIVDVEEKLDAINVMRGLLKSELHKEKKDRLIEYLDTWFREITGLIQETEDLRLNARYRPETTVRVVESLQEFKHQISVTMESLGREQAVIAGVLASKRQFDLDDLRKVSDYHGRVSTAWDFIKQATRDMDPGSPIRVEVKTLDREMLPNLDWARNKIMRNGLSGAAYVTTPREWIDLVDRVIEPIFSLIDHVNTLSKRAIADRQREDRRNMVMYTGFLALIVLLAGLTFYTVEWRIIRPVLRITKRMSALAAGKQVGQIIYRERRDEIGAMANAVQAFRDAQEQSRANLVQLNEDLERKVAERTAELEVAYQQAVEANAAKSTFLANMSHELRTPLNAIIGYSEILMEEAEDLGQEEYLPDLEKIRSSGKHLLSLINDILDLSKIEAGKMDVYLEDFNVREMVDDVTSTIAPLADKNGNALKVECDPAIGDMHGDLTKLRQSLFNLLSNACKFTDKGTVTVRVLRQGQESIVFDVIDTGIGMTPEQAEAVFGEFQQADSSTTREYGGTGLGLAISRNFCELLGGSLTVESEVGKGSTFTITMPAHATDPASVEAAVEVAIAEAETITDESASDVEPGARTILVIDDDETVRDLLSRFLTRNGFNVVTAVDGDEGLKLARQVKPDAITVDVLMPKVDGWAVLRTLKEDEETADIPVIVISIVDDRNMGFALGAAEYLTKPVDRDKLLNVLSRLCPDGKKHRILIVEDESETREMMRRMVDRESWDTSEAANGIEGLAQLEKEAPDVILLDLMMPQMDGFQFLAKIRENDEWASIPVVVVTAKSLTAEDRNFLDGRVNRLVQKGEEDLKGLLTVLNDALPMDTVSTVTKD